MNKLFENWRRHTNEEQEIVTEDPGLDLAYNAIAWTIAAIVLQYWPLTYPEVKSALKKIPDQKRKELETQIRQKFAEEPASSLDEELRDYTGGQSRSPDLQIPGYGIMTVEQVERKLARMLQEAAEDAMKDPPQYSHLNNGVIQALHKALKDFKEL